MRNLGLETLESRVVLSGDFPSADRPFVAYMPEGYASEHINEFVPITNSGDTDVAFELYARYEDGQPGVLVADGVLAAHTRGGVTISDAMNGGPHGVRSDQPYALVLRASGRLSATLSHYDFGTAIGESFYEGAERNWIFPELGRDASGHTAQDYVLVYNPDDHPVNLTFTMISDRGLTRVFTRSVGAMQRGGWAINDLPGLPPGLWSGIVDSDGPIIACASIYRPLQERGYGLVGIPNGGATAGVLSSIGFDDTFYDRNGDDRGRGIPRFTPDSFISIFNPGSFDARVVITILPEGGGDAVDQRVVTVEAGSRLTLSMRDYDLENGSRYTAVYVSDQSVAMSGAVFQGLDATGSQAGAAAATVWEFGEGYMSRSRGGHAVIENLRLFNPGQNPVTVSIEFQFSQSTFTYVPDDPIAPGSTLIIDIDQIAGVRDRAENVWYGIRVVSSAPIFASLEHWDAGNGGGFCTPGMPSGNFAQVATLLDRSIFDPPGRPGFFNDLGRTPSAADAGLSTPRGATGGESVRIWMFGTDGRTATEDVTLLSAEAPAVPAPIELMASGA